MGRIVPIYEAVGTFGSRMIRPRDLHTLQNLDSSIPTCSRRNCGQKLHYPLGARL